MKRAMLSDKEGWDAGQGKARKAEVRLTALLASILLQSFLGGVSL